MGDECLIEIYIPFSDDRKIGTLIFQSGDQVMFFHIVYPLFIQDRGKVNYPIYYEPHSCFVRGRNNNKETKCTTLLSDIYKRIRQDENTNYATISTKEKCRLCGIYLIRIIRIITFKIMSVDFALNLCLIFGATSSR